MFICKEHSWIINIFPINTLSDKCSRCNKRKHKIMLWSLPEQTLEFVCNICNKRAIKDSDYHSVITHSDDGTLSNKILEKGIFG